MKKLLLSLIVLFSTTCYAHDNETRNLYASALIYGFIDHCYKDLLQNQFMNESLWPHDIKNMCGCMMDNYRTKVTAEDFSENWKDPLSAEKTAMAKGIAFACQNWVLEQKANEK